MFSTPDEPARLTMNPAEIRKFLNIDHQTLKRLLDSGQLDSIRSGRQRLVPRQSLVEFIADSACSAWKEPMSVQLSMFD